VLRRNDSGNNFRPARPGVLWRAAARAAPLAALALNACRDSSQSGAFRHRTPHPPPRQVVILNAREGSRREAATFHFRLWTCDCRKLTSADGRRWKRQARGCSLQPAVSSHTPGRTLIRGRRGIMICLWGIGPDDAPAVTCTVRPLGADTVRMGVCTCTRRPERPRPRPRRAPGKRPRRPCRPSGFGLRVSFGTRTSEVGLGRRPPGRDPLDPSGYGRPPIRTCSERDYSPVRRGSSCPGLALISGAKTIRKPHCGCRTCG
jgi:hypothetical protein